MEIPGFRIERLIAEGGMSSVYLAVQESLGRCVALKLLKAFDSPGHTKRFLCEARTIAALEHNNIITIHDVGVVGEQHYIAMEYLEGGSLRERIGRGMHPDEALDLLGRMAACLDYVHRRDVIHRDIKPSNILFHADGTPKLTDFGIALDLDDDQGTVEQGRIFGSPYYLSPEQVDGRPLDGRADIYAMGIMLFEMLTGRKPYAESGHVDTILAHLSQPVPLLPEAQAGYQRLLERMVAKRPEDRIGSAKELLDAIDQARRAQRRLTFGSHGDAARTWAGLGPRLRQAPLVAATTAGLVIVAIGAGLVPDAKRAGDGARVATAPTPSVETRNSGPRPRPVDTADGAAVTSTADARPADGLATAAGGAPAPVVALGHAARADGEVAASGGAAVAAGAANAGRPRPAGVAQDALEPVASIPDPGPAVAVAAEPGIETDLTADATAGATGEVPGPAVVAGADDADPDATPTASADASEAAARAQPGVHTVGMQAQRVAAPQPVDAPLGAMPSDADDRAAQIAAWMADGDRALAAIRLTTPAGDNAFEHYARVLELDPGHAGARRGMDNIADYYVGLARKAVEQRDYRRARLYVRRGQVVRSDHAGLRATARAIEQARAGPRAQPQRESVVAALPGEAAPVHPADTQGTGNLIKDLRSVWRSIFD